MPLTRLPSEVTGTVWKVEVCEGDVVAAEQTLVILESMKMEIPVSAPIDCTVVEILVAEGDTVAEGQAVAVIEG